MITLVHPNPINSALAMNAWLQAQHIVHRHAMKGLSAQDALQLFRD